jgi:hypothetical protein
MGAGVNNYSLVAADNTAVNGNNIAENNLPSTINNALRQMCADIRALMEDIAGTPTSTGTNAIAVTTNTGWAAYADGMIVGWKAGNTITAAATLNVNAIGAKDLVRGLNTALVSGDIIQGQLCLACYRVATDDFHLLNVPAIAPVTASSTATFTNKTFDANGSGNVLSNVEVADFAASAIVTEAEGISANDNDTTIPTSAAVNNHVVGKQTVWIPAAAMTPRTTNGAASQTQELATNDVMLTSLNFDATTEEFAEFQIAMPKGWDEGTLTFVPYWSHPATVTNFGVVWSLEGQAVSNDDALDAGGATHQDSTDTGGTTDDLYVGPESAAITIGGTPAEGDMILFHIRRRVASGSDTMAVDARLHGIKLIYTTNAAKDD